MRFRARGGHESGGLAAALLLVALSGSAGAEHLRGSVAAVPLAPPRAAAPAPEPADLSGRRSELRGLEDNLGVSAEQRRKIEAEIQSLRADRARLAQALIDAAARIEELEKRAEEVAARLDASRRKEQALVKSLAGRRELIGEVLLVLQRMDRRPPPALLARPEDILEGIRAAMLLGSVLPQMRGEIETLKADLGELVALRGSIETEKTSLAREVADLEEQRVRLAALVDARQKALMLAQSALDFEAERAKALAAKATSLKELIARMEGEVEAARRAAEAARQADAAREAADAAASRASRVKALAAPFKDAARLAPAVAFADLKGRLPLPAAGAVVKRFGAPDGAGGAEKGVSIAVRDKAVVASPCDGWVIFSGPYRSYGQLLIISAGGGYYVTLAGMDQISVAVGQFVLAGEPVANMGGGAVRTAAAIAIGAKQPILYVEFRKDGASIDPGPWWAKPEIQKVGG
ncbi:murein hydrolase activator EnvC [Methylosinus sp. Sm6]|uniref:murein hydrolase activator EnvC family protein n=1 Tax=Methylosinus sp. Sm6 TaxID=2866948 RepID=UPI001C99857A|nr:peptidoglycan DD-metalloendopeptidase family protein [Methylosinus sp. Sm6]MBY6240562.1 peptidoglycan DD-metalloendopeptidase family protein [Methylosinus sp. Sm6]